MDAQQPWKKKGGTASWMAAAGALESGDSELEPRLQLLRGHARVSLLARHLKVTVFFRLLASSKLGMQNCKVSRDLNPPIESKLSRDNFDSIALVDSSHVILCSFAFRVWTKQAT